MNYQFYTADVFTDRMFGGNQLAVLPDARGLDADQMQKIAREFNLAETTFVFPAESPAHTRKLRIFTPGAEVPFAGHPTVGTAFVLASAGLIPLEGDTTNIVFEEGVGPVPVTISCAGGRPSFCRFSVAQLPEPGPPPPATALLAGALSLDPSDIMEGNEFPQAFSCGLPFLYVPVKTIAAVRRARVRIDLWERATSDYWTELVYVFSRETDEEQSDIHARMFASSFGIEEDPATGSAASALAGYLAPREALRDGTLHWRVEQGFEMGRPSIIEVEADKREGELADVRVGGKAVMVMRGEIDL